MKIIINTSNICIGGALQVAISFINELPHLNINHSYHIFISNAINKQININEFPKNFKFYYIDKSPAPLKYRYHTIKKLTKLEKIINPDIVFSVFGPSYWKPFAKHILGFADGWVYNEHSIAYNKLTFIKNLKIKLTNYYKIYYLRRDANYYILETGDARNKFINTLKEREDNVFVVGNTYSTVFDNPNYLCKKNKYYIKLPKNNNDCLRLVYIAYNHVNKNIDIIKKVIPYLEKYNIEFILTLDNRNFQNIFKKNYKNIINIGFIPQKSCPSIYAQCDALFAPTLLETFSASYPEAMKMEKPILTSNLSFAKDICQDAAIYFNPLDPKDIADKIKVLINNKKLINNIVKKGKRKLSNFETANSRAKKYIEICENIHKK
jgi:glycosyltransferase involved in cell wall biosynthesis